MRGPSLRAAAAVLTACGGATLIGPSAWADSIDFNAGATDLTNNFSVNFDGAPVSTAPGGGGNFNWNANGGISGGGGLLNPNTTDATAEYIGPNHATTDTAFKLTSGASVSVMFTSANIGTDRTVQVGFVNKFSTSFNNDGANAAVSAAQRAISGATAFLSVRVYGTGQLEQQTKASGSNSAATLTVRTADPFLPLIDNEWYKLTLSVTETAASTFTLLSTLDDYGGDGSRLVSNLFTQTSSTPVSITGFDNSANDVGVGNALGAVRQVTNNPQMDNFVMTGTSVQAPVPEPASLGLLALGGVGLLARRRARR